MVAKTKSKKSASKKKSSSKKPGSSKLHKPLKSQDFYCVACRAKGNPPVRRSRHKDNICVEILTNPRTGKEVIRLVSSCDVCKYKLYKFQKLADKEKLLKKFNKC